MDLNSLDLGVLLGKGGFAHVYRCRIRNNQQEVALKIISKEKFNPNNEIAIQKNIVHPAIVQLYTTFADEKNVYLVLECCQMNLYRYLKQAGSLSERNTGYVIKQLLEALQHLHGHGILHRDLKLSNILISAIHSREVDTLDVKLCDFGLALQLHHPDEEHYTLCGTPNYIAPEMITAQMGHSFPVDLWAVGCLTYSLLTGTPPFESVANGTPGGSTSHVQATLQSIVQGVYSIPSQISPPTVSFLNSLLNLNPMARPNVSVLLQHVFLRGIPSRTDYSGGKSTDISFDNHSSAATTQESYHPMLTSAMEVTTSYEGPKISPTEPIHRLPVASPTSLHCGHLSKPSTSSKHIASPPVNASIASLASSHRYSSVASSQHLENTTGSVSFSNWIEAIKSVTQKPPSSRIPYFDENSLRSSYSNELRSSLPNIDNYLSLRSSMETTGSTQVAPLRASFNGTTTTSNSSPRISVGQLPPFAFATSQANTLLVYLSSKDLLILTHLRNQQGEQRCYRLIRRHTAPYHLEIGSITSSMTSEVHQLRQCVISSEEAQESNLVLDDFSLKTSQLVSKSNILKSYALNALPPLLLKCMQKCSIIIEEIQSRVPRLILYLSESESESILGPKETPRARIRNKIACKCMLMCNGPLPDFCIQWMDGTKLRYTLSSGKLSLQGPSVEPFKYTEVFDDGVFWADVARGNQVKYLLVAQEAMRRCIEEMNGSTIRSAPRVIMADERKL